MCCKVRNISAPPNAGGNIPFYQGLFSKVRFTNHQKTQILFEKETGLNTNAEAKEPEITFNHSAQKFTFLAPKNRAYVLKVVK